MSWDRILLEVVSPQAELAPHIHALFDQQQEHWQALRDGEAARSSVKTKELTHSGASVIVQANPGRRKSVLAKVDPQSIAERQCFLCPQNMPAEERGVGWRDLVILPNPYPILPHHCTIPSREHRPQQLAGRIEAMLELARAIGPEMLIYYNGPRCGASAPDHFHCQACDAAGVPLFRELFHSERTSPRTNHVSFGRRMLVFDSTAADAVRCGIERALGAMRQLASDACTGGPDEPMINLLAFYRDGCYFGVLFPRAAHRPACHFAEDTQRIAISPAALEMAGILVVAEPDHFDRVDAATAHLIYEEVSLGEVQFTQLAHAIR